jgi:enolase
MTKIKHVTARQLLDCKCRPLVEVDIITDKGELGRGAAPTGSSVGMYESYVLRDNDTSEYNGMSVHKAVDNVLKIIAPELIGMDVCDQRAIDQKMIELDGTPNKSNLGGNAIYSTSIAAFRAAAETANKPAYEYLCGRSIKTIPVPCFNVVNGGRYGDIVLSFNEFLIVPYKADSIYEAVEIAVKCFQKLGDILQKYLGKTPEVARSYGWAAPSNDPIVVLGLLQEVVDACGYHEKVAFALDCASSEMYDAKRNKYFLKDGCVSSLELIDYVRALSEQFPLVFIEDILDENDWENYPKAVEMIKRSIIIGDDLIASNPERLRRAYETRAVDGFVLKPNQVGTLTEALDAHYYSKKRGMFSVPSGRAGGVVGDVIMDLAVGLEVGFIKNGAPRSGERIDKLNFLMRACDLTQGCHMADITGIVRF